MAFLLGFLAGGLSLALVLGGGIYCAARQEIIRVERLQKLEDIYENSISED